MASGSGSYGTAVQIEIKEPVRGKTEPYDSFPVGCKPIVKHRNGFVGAKFGWRQIAEIDHAIAHCSQDAFFAGDLLRNPVETARRLHAAENLPLR